MPSGTPDVEGAMLAAYRRVAPFLLTGVLLLNVAIAIVTGQRATWLMVAVLALVLALNVWWWRRAGQEPKDPHQR